MSSNLPLAGTNLRQTGIGWDGQGGGRRSGDPVIGTSIDQQGQILPLINTDDADLRGIPWG